MEALFDTESSEDWKPRRYLLHNAAEEGDVDTLTRLLSKEKVRGTEQETNEKVDGSSSDEEGLTGVAININGKDQEGHTALHIAILNGRAECCQVLAEHGANVSIMCDGNPPLLMAICQGSHALKREIALHVVKLLLAHGSSPYERDDNGRCALHWASLYGLYDIAHILLKYAENTNVVDQDSDDDSAEQAVPLVELQDRPGDTPLHLVAKHGHLDLLKLLLQGGESCDPSGALHTMNRQGYLPIHCAALSGATEAVAKLARTAPDTVSALDKKGRTPAQVAEVRGHPNVKQYLMGDLDEAPDSAPSASVGPTAFIVSEDCLAHRTAPEPLTRGKPIPPENVNRLHVLLDKGYGILRGGDFSKAVWDANPPLAQMADVLRVHDWNYVNRIKGICESVKDEPSCVGNIDGDTTLSRGSFQAALRAAGAVCSAVDKIMKGEVRNAFCAVRPPGHHAGPLGKVICRNDPSGSNGFCLLNNIAIGAAYALNVYRHQGVKRVALVDFDVHHGNGTEACVLATRPSVNKVMFKTPFSEGIQVFQEFRPWLGYEDSENILFASCQAYGSRFPGIDGAWFYPGSGKTSDTRVQAQDDTDDMPLAESNGCSRPGECDDVVKEDPHQEFVPKEKLSMPQKPRIINVGIHGPGVQVQVWKRAWRDKILPAIVNFDPDMIFVSAGFDAHRKDEINHNFIGLLEEHFEWITDQIVQVANRCCDGRLVSALEGGYRIQGGNVSAFARSVAAHARSLMDNHSQKWDESEAEIEREVDRERREKRLRSKEDQRRREIQEELEKLGVTYIQQQEGDVWKETPAKEGTPRAKRAKTNDSVNYAALNKELEAEESARKLAQERQE